MPEIMFFSVFGYFDPFKVVFSVKFRRKSCSPSILEYFEKKIFHTMSNFWPLTSFLASFLAQNFVFWALLRKMSSFWPIKVVWRLICQEKVIPLDVLNNLKKNFCSVTTYFWHMTSFFAQNDVIRPFLTQMSSFHPFKVVLRLNCQRKSCST